MEALLSLILLLIVLIAVCLAVFFGTILPIWGIIDCAARVRSGAERVIWIVAMLLTWTFGALLYGLFGTSSWLLKRVTRGSAMTAVMCLFVFGGIVAVYPTAKDKLPGPLSNKIASDSGESSGQASSDPAIATAAIDPSSLASLFAINYVPTGRHKWSVSIAQFGLNGPIADTAIPIDPPSIYPVTHIAVDPKGPTYYGITTHKVGKIIQSTGKFIELEMDPALPELSWPSGVAFDSKRRKLIMTSRSGGYSYDPSTGEWKQLEGLDSSDYAALAYDAASGLTYALAAEFGTEHATKIVAINSKGAVLRTIELSNAIETDRYPNRKVQIAIASDQLIILVSPRYVTDATSKQDVLADGKMYAVNLDSGAVSQVGE